MIHSDEKLRGVLFKGLRLYFIGMAIDTTNNTEKKWNQVGGQWQTIKILQIESEWRSMGRGPVGLVRLFATSRIVSDLKNDGSKLEHSYDSAVRYWKDDEMIQSERHQTAHGPRWRKDRRERGPWSVKREPWTPPKE
jgi:hypothetical protein